MFIRAAMSWSRRGSSRCGLGSRSACTSAGTSAISVPLASFIARALPHATGRPLANTADFFADDSGSYDLLAPIRALAKARVDASEWPALCRRHADAMSVPRGWRTCPGAGG